MKLLSKVEMLVLFVFLGVSLFGYFYALYANGKKKAVGVLVLGTGLFGVFLWAILGTVIHSCANG